MSNDTNMATQGAIGAEIAMVSNDNALRKPTRKGHMPTL